MNERDIANGFSAVWSEFFPMLSPTFIVAFNEAFVRPILGSGGIVQPVSSKVKTARPDVLAEFGFRLASTAIQAGVPVRAAARDKLMLDAADSAAAKRIREFRPELPLDELRLNEPEQQEGVRLAAVYEEFLGLWPTEAATFSPMVRGNGLLSSCFADLSVGSTLFEVKTVARPFHSRDLRQLLVYLALQSATGERRWDNGGLFNPRLSVFCTFSIDWLVTRLSGGRPPKMVFTDFVQSLARDLVLDRRF
ncbi:MAG: hypothetical protein ABSA54_16460 [Terriglobales bacterium]|jgi:hypothetical protein